MFYCKSPIQDNRDLSPELRERPELTEPHKTQAKTKMALFSPAALSQLQNTCLWSHFYTKDPYILNSKFEKKVPALRYYQQILSQIIFLKVLRGETQLPTVHLPWDSKERHQPRGLSVTSF